MATPDERIILEIIEEEGGECTEGKILQEMPLRRDYLRVILQSMGFRDLIDYMMNPRRCRIANRGWQALGKSPQYGPVERWMADYNRRMEESRKKEEKGEGETEASGDFYTDYVREMREKEEYGNEEEYGT